MSSPDPEDGRPRVVIRDKRRIDPVTGEVRAPAGGAVEVDEGAIGGVPSSGGGDAQGDVTADGGELDTMRTEVAERTADLQRVSAEYANYRRRVERDRQAVIALAKAQVAAELLTVLDDVERAAEHGDLSGAFKSVADKLVTALSAQGLEPFGAPGEVFDPDVHEAVQHTTSGEVTGPTVTAVLRRGYRFADRVLRPAMVAVTDHEPVPATDDVEQANGAGPEAGAPDGAEAT